MEKNTVIKVDKMRMLHPASYTAPISPASMITYLIGEQELAEIKDELMKRMVDTLNIKVELKITI